MAIALSYFANVIAQRPKNPRKTFGYKRAEILAAFVNSAVLLAISVFLIFEAIRRWQAPEAINGTLMIIVASIGLSANLLSVILLEKDSHGNLNIRSSYLHLLSDTVSSVGVVIGGIAINIWGVVWIDPADHHFDFSLHSARNFYNFEKDGRYPDAVISRFGLRSDQT